MPTNNEERRFPSTSVPSTLLLSKALSVASAGTYNYPHFIEEEAEAQRKAVARGCGVGRGSTPGLPSSDRRSSHTAQLLGSFKLPLVHQARRSLRTEIRSHSNPCLPQLPAQSRPQCKRPASWSRRGDESLVFFFLSHVLLRDVIQAPGFQISCVA